MRSRAASDLFQLVPKIIEEGIGFRGRAGLTRYQENRPRQIDPCLDCLDSRRMRAVKHLQLGVTRGVAEGLLKYLRRQA